MSYLKLQVIINYQQDVKTLREIILGEKSTT